MIVQMTDQHLEGVEFVVTRADGKVVDFSQLVSDFVWSDHVNVAGAEVSLECQGSADLINQIGLEGSTSLITSILPDVASGQAIRREIWRGLFEEVSDEATSGEVTRLITAYDIGKLLASDEEDYVIRGESLSRVVQRVCQDFSIPIISIPETFAGLGDIISRGEDLWSGVFQKAVQKHKDLTGEVYRIRFERGGLVMIRQGSADRYWIFEVGRSIERLRRVRSITDLENRVRIYGQVADELAKPKVEADIQNTQSQDIYGLRQRVEYVATADDRQKVFDVSQQRINKNSIPSETIEVTGWVVPLLRGGDTVHVVHPEMGINGIYFAESIECQWSADTFSGIATCRREPIDPGLFLDELVVA